jgi:hypothetical protein
MEKSKEVKPKEVEKGRPGERKPEIEGPRKEGRPVGKELKQTGESKPAEKEIKKPGESGPKSQDVERPKNRLGEKEEIEKPGELKPY